MDDRPVLVFDGECGFCSSCARLLERWVRSRARIEPWQRLDLAAHGLTTQQAEESVQWVEPGGRRSSGALAFAHYLQSARAPWPWLGRVLALPPVQLVARPAYSWVSRNRHRMPGGTPVSRVDPDDEGRG